MHMYIFGRFVLLLDMRQFFLDAKTQFHKGFCYFLQPS